MNEQEYVEKIEAMIQQFSRYRKTHPDVELLVDFKAPEKMMICGTIPDAITGGFLAVNAAAMHMFQELGWIREGISYLMLKVAIDYEQDTTDGACQEAPRPRF